MGFASCWLVGLYGFVCLGGGSWGMRLYGLAMLGISIACASLPISPWWAIPSAVVISVPVALINNALDKRHADDVYEAIEEERRRSQ